MQVHVRAFLSFPLSLRLNYLLEFFGGGWVLFLVIFFLGKPNVQRELGIALDGGI